MSVLPVSTAIGTNGASSLGLASQVQGGALQASSGFNGVMAPSLGLYSRATASVVRSRYNTLLMPDVAEEIHTQENFPPCTKIPQFRHRVEFDRRLHDRMESVPELAMRYHQALGDLDPVFFTYNNVKWWHDLAQREYPHLGPEGLLETGAMVFGNHIKDEGQRVAFQDILRAKLIGMDIGSDFSIGVNTDELKLKLSGDIPNHVFHELKKPTIEFWTALWPAILLAPEKKYAAHVLRQIREQSEETASELIDQIRRKSPEWNSFMEEVNELSFDTFEFDLVPLPDSVRDLVHGYHVLKKQEDWSGCNRVLGEVYQDVWALQDWDAILTLTEVLTKDMGGAVPRQVAHRIDWNGTFFTQKKYNPTYRDPSVLLGNLTEEQINQVYQAYAHDPVSVDFYWSQLRIILYSVRNRILGGETLEKFERRAIEQITDTQTPVFSEETIQTLQTLFELGCLNLRLREDNPLVHGKLPQGVPVYKQDGERILATVYRVCCTIKDEMQDATPAYVEKILHEMDVMHLTQEKQNEGVKPYFPEPAAQLFLTNDHVGQVAVNQDIESALIEEFIHYPGQVIDFFGKALDISTLIGGGASSSTQKKFDYLYWIRGMVQITNAILNVLESRDSKNSPFAKRDGIIPMLPGAEEKTTPWPGQSPFNFENLPRESLDKILEEHRHLIPYIGSDIVLFDRFQRILDEVSSIVQMSPMIPIRLFGSSSTGKSTIPELVAARMGIPLLRFPNSPRTDQSDYEGLWSMKMIDPQNISEKDRELFEGASQVDGFQGFEEFIQAGQKILVPVFEEGVTQVAIENGYHLVLDDPNMARPGVLAFLNNYIQPGKTVRVRGRSGDYKTIRVHSRYRVWVTEGSGGEVGRQVHDEAFLRRFVPIYVGTWTQDEMVSVIENAFQHHINIPEWNKAFSKLVAKLGTTLIEMARGYQFKDPQSGEDMFRRLGGDIHQQVNFTPRTILRFCERIQRSQTFTPEVVARAFRSEFILPLADEGDREQVWALGNQLFQTYFQSQNWPLDTFSPNTITRPTARTIADDYFDGVMPDLGDDFTWTEHTLNLADEILWNFKLGIDVLLVGRAGEGKTYIPEKIAEMLKTSYGNQNLSPDSDYMDLVGTLTKRPNGEVSLVPGLAMDVTQNGGVGHFDEFFVADPTLLEEFFGPLMDSRQSLFLKNPYRAVKRHKDSHFIMSTNPYWGNYNERFVPSSNLLSRMSVICLSGKGWSMSSGDRVDLLQRRNTRFQNPDPNAGSWEIGLRDGMAQLADLLDQGPPGA